ncbi:MAG TPA: ribosome silencing factor [Firmicutes bacterium]|jgi:ribosome-associated protein|nr:ribosome silencing factor [Bacillota bacterium]
MDSRAKALLAARAAGEKKAKDVIILDIQHLSPFCDYFVIASGSSGIQVKAIAEVVEGRLSEAGFSLDHREGQNDSGWILLDYGDVVIHVFIEEKRVFYDLERLWGDAKRVEIKLA